MSHTSTISNIIISDVHSLRSAIKELTDQGVRCELLKDAIPRAYFSDQQGMGKAPYVVKLVDGKYDVGLYENKEGQGYEARADFFGGHIEKLLGVNDSSPSNPGQAKMGKLYQMYAVHAATRKAIQNGHQVRRINQLNGGVQLEVTVAA